MAEGNPLLSGPQVQVQVQPQVQTPGPALPMGDWGRGRGRAGCHTVVSICRTVVVWMCGWRTRDPKGCSPKDGRQ